MTDEAKNMVLRSNFCEDFSTDGITNEKNLPWLYASNLTHNEIAFCLS